MQTTLSWQPNFMESSLHLTTATVPQSCLTSTDTGSVPWYTHETKRPWLSPENSTSMLYVPRFLSRCRLQVRRTLIVDSRPWPSRRATGCSRQHRQLRSTLKGLLVSRDHHGKLLLLPCLPGCAVLLSAPSLGLCLFVSTPITLTPKAWLTWFADLVYARTQLPVLAAIIMSDRVPRGDLIEIPLPFPRAWLETVAFVYTGNEEFATAQVKQNVLYLGGRV